MTGLRILVVGAGGTLGSAVREALAGRGHTVVTAGRSSGDLRVDATDPSTVAQLYAEVGRLDAVVSTIGSTPFRPVRELSAEDYAAAFYGKVAPQLELVRQGIPVLAERGSFTLTSGILARAPIHSGAAAAMANGALEAFVRAAAAELAPQRINAVSPSVLLESLAKYDKFFPGFPTVPGAEVARVFVRCVEGVETGVVHALP